MKIFQCMDCATQPYVLVDLGDCFDTRLEGIQVKVVLRNDQLEVDLSEKLGQLKLFLKPYELHNLSSSINQYLEICRTLICPRCQNETIEIKEQGAQAQLYFPEGT